jgi:hypothetical protein
MNFDRNGENNEQFGMIQPGLGDIFGVC